VREKLKVFGIPMLAATILIMVLFTHQLLNMKKLPNEDWSRSISLQFKGEELPLIFQKDNAVYLTKENSVSELVLDKELKIKDMRDIDVDIPRGFPFWTDGENFITLSKGVLSWQNGKVQETLDENVSGIATYENFVLYWKAGNLLEYDTKTKEVRELHNFKNEISDLVIGDDGNFLVMHQLDDINGEIYFGRADGGIVNNPIVSLKNPIQDQIKNLNFIISDGELFVYFGRRSRTNGMLSFNVYQASGDINSLGEKPLSIQKMEFFNKKTHAKLISPENARILSFGNENKLVFTAEGQEIDDSNVKRVYSGNIKNENEVFASNISTNNHVAQNPLKINEESLIWLSYSGEDYQLYGASQNPQVKLESIKLSIEDGKEAAYKTVVMMFSSLVTVLTSFYWFLPTLTLLIMLYIFKPNIFEKDDINWVEYVGIIIFLVMPFTYMSKAMNQYFYEVAPPYYTFTNSGIVILVVLSVLSALIWKWGRHPDWGTFAGVFYFMFVYLFLYISSVGPYIFNLF
jgi:hypothetical protein